MGITQEADYALRIVYQLAKDGGQLDAGTIAGNAGVTDRFTVKILRKLVQSGMVRSQKGAAGGYRLAVPPDEINIRQVIEAIDGPLAISKCLDADYTCTRMGDEKSCCAFHCIFARLNDALAKQMETVTLDRVIGEDADITQILSNL